jgi:excisionase family DNA binding protein
MHDATTTEHSTTPPLLLTIPDAARVLAVGRSTLYELIGVGALNPVHIGRSVRIRVDELRQFVDGPSGDVRGRMAS